MVRIKSLEQIKAGYKAGASKAPEAYKAGIAATTGWKEAATSESAEALYAAKIQEAVANRSRQKGLANVSEEQWKSNAINKGGNVIGQRMAASADKQAAGFAPYRETIANLSLPARTADPMTNITQRVGGVAMALHAKKKELRG